MSLLGFLFLNKKKMEYTGLEPATFDCQSNALAR